MEAFSCIVQACFPFNSTPAGSRGTGSPQRDAEERVTKREAVALAKLGAGTTQVGVAPRFPRLWEGLPGSAPRDLRPRPTGRAPTCLSPASLTLQHQPPGSRSSVPVGRIQPAARGQQSRKLAIRSSLGVQDGGHVGGARQREGLEGPRAAWVLSGPGRAGWITMQVAPGRLGSQRKRWERPIRFQQSQPRIRGAGVGALFRIRAL